MTLRPRTGLSNVLVGALASAGAVALVTAAISVVRPYVPVLSLGVVYVFAVLPVSHLTPISSASTMPVSTSAPAHAWRCQSGNGEIA